MQKKKLNAKTEARIKDLLRRGQDLQKHQQIDAAIVEFRKALAMDPTYDSTCQILGMLYHKLGQNDLAAPLLARVVKVHTNRADFHCAYGAALSAIGDHEKSSRYHKRALELNPEYLIAQFNYSQEMMFLGDIPAAIAGFERVLEIDPRCAAAYKQLIGLRKFSEYTEEMRVMETLLEELDGEDRKLMTFGLADAYRKIGHYEKSFAYLAEANRLHRATINYSVKENERTFREIRRAFNAQTLAVEVAPVDHATTPIFIVGMPRSGTTLTEQILASHSAVFGCGELKNMGRIYVDTFGGHGDLLFKVQQLQPERRAAAARRYLDEVAAMAGGKPYVTDKMPHNFLFLGLIATAFPDARIILCERSPMDNCLSIFSYLFTGNHPYSYDLEELGDYYLQYRELMEHWKQLLPGRIHTLSYESLVADTETEVRRLLEYCGLPFEEACLSFFETNRAVATVSATQVRQPIYTSSVEGWRRYEKELAPLSKVLGLQ